MVPETPSPIDPETLRQLTEQLCHWAEGLISRGRSPLRKVEAFPSLLTAKGEQQPPLLFWINRDSCMAGGVVLFPAANDKAAFETGHACAEALGLRYFVTWTRTEISFWDDTAPPRLRKQIPLANGCRAEARDFQEALQLLLEEIKLLAVLAAVPPPELSPCYLANLWRTTLTAAEPLLQEHYRIARSEQRLAEGAVPETMATGKAYLTLARLLALNHHGIMPSEMPPQHLEEEIRQALPALPPGLRTALAMPDGESPLPEPVAVRFHLLFRRLTQLRPASDLQRRCQALTLLLAHDNRRLGGYAPPFPAPAAKGTLLLNPDRVYETVEPSLEFASAPLLAVLALLRSLCGQPAVGQIETLWQTPDDFLPGHIRGTLGEGHRPSAEGRHRFMALLRRSWPNRRFRLPPATPTWTWQLLHLLGLADVDATIELRLPDGWLTSDYGLPVLELMQKHFTLERLCDQGDGWLTLRLQKTEGGQQSTVLENGNCSRTVEWPWLSSHHPALLPLALYLPQPLLTLLENGLLCLPTGQAWPAQQLEAIFCFTRSALGQSLWQLLGAGRPLPRRAQLEKELLRSGFPLPPVKVLEQLQRAISDEVPSGTRQNAFERELSLWLGSDLGLAAPPRTADSRAAAAESTAVDAGKQADQIAAEVFVDGLPNFPEQYLYDYYRPELRQYKFTPPLSRGAEFFGRVELIDQRGRTLEAEDPDSARALLLCAAAGATQTALPVDGQITATIVQRYLADLRQLHQTLSRTCHRHCTDPDAAATLAEAVWASQSLPPWQTVLEMG